MKWLVVVASLAAAASCSTRTPVTISPTASSESRQLGRVHVTKTDGAQAVIESAYIRGDTLFGHKREEVAFGTKRANVAIPISEVKGLQRQTMNVGRTVALAGLAGLVVFGLISSLSVNPPAGY